MRVCVCAKTLSVRAFKLFLLRLVDHHRQVVLSRGRLKNDKPTGWPERFRPLVSDHDDDEPL